MQLRLSIERKACRDKLPTSFVLHGHQRRCQDQEVITLDVNDTDTVLLYMIGKDANDTIVNQDGNVVEDVAVIVKSIYLENVNFTHCAHRLPYCNLEHQTLPSNAYMSKNGYMTLDIGWLLQQDYDYNSIEYLSLDQVYLEVLGRLPGQVPQVKLQTE
jgi:hypothetical protein